MSNILIVGGSGFLGHYLIKQLKNKNNLYCYINRTLIKDFSLTTVKFNLRNKIKLKEFILKYKIDLIINLSSIASVDICEKFKKKAYKTHVIIPRILSKIGKLLNIKVVHISTDHLFNGKSRTSYSEKSAVNPLNYYAKTKKYSEKEISKSKKNLIIRTNFFGNNKINKNSFSDKIIINLKKKKNVHLWSDVYFSPMHIKYLCIVIEFLINKNEKGIYNISTKKISKYKLGVLIAKRLKLDFKKIIPTEFDPKKFIIRPKNMSLSNQRLLTKYPNLKKYLLLNSQINILKKNYK
jgi:dTDP-4-dehydrorhamnose reductase